MQIPQSLSRFLSCKTFAKGTRETIPHRRKMGQGVARRSAAVVIAVTLQRLIEDGKQAWSVEEHLVIEALRRSSSDLSTASEQDLGSYLARLGPDQLRGVISNVKGIYHEMLFAAAENANGDAVTAHLHETTNHQGSDVFFTSIDGEVIGEVQLKAVASPTEVYDHLATYPGINIRVKEEVAERMMRPDVTGSGFSNEQLDAEVREAFGLLEGETIPDEVLDTANSSILIGAAFMARGALRDGKVNPNALRSAMGDLGVGLTTAFILDAILTGA
ncbi:hypothetical protein Q4543_18435 [Salipiger sp. 1_MG-2023]|uniref:hypothetical protein n=1 Tax=Salipiger sp. 1_MG-2023 TaxID=3062665 RepID=UPI0026E25CEA|nr:hypothetical protein [Salipiger sp. 1_MG-2023]MDO6587495.1 hypothetical protein [Salipiger sp. 1_MG-2023]